MKSAQVCGSLTLLASIEDWVMEGHRLAQTVAYGNLSNDNPSPITPEYERQADPVIELQLEKGGVRLAHLLDASLMNVPRIYDLEPVGKLNVLRVYWVHKLDQLESTKRQAAVRVLAELTGRDSLSSPSELDSSDYQKAAVALLKRLNEQVLDHALAALRVN